MTRPSHTSPTRRQLILGASAATGASLLPRLAMSSATAANTSGYRALVCIFLYGGMDGHDFLLPTDQASYDTLRQSRTSLMDAYLRNSNWSKRQRTDLLELSPHNATAFGSRGFGLPAEMPELHRLFETDKAAILANVGPLVEPTAKAAITARTATLPKHLFSHNDQQSTWMALSPEGARFGWGGLFADRMISANANLEPAFTAISAGGNAVFLSGQQVRPFQISPRGAVEVADIESGQILASGGNSSVATTLFEEHLRAIGTTRANLFERDIAAIENRSVDLSRRFNESVSGAVDLMTPFPTTSLGNQLKTIATTIAQRGVTGASRQVFFAKLGGFDTHSRQTEKIPKLQRALSEAIGAFYDATVELGVSDQVTLFTASDFGRTLTSNGDGTDHGWGGHQIIVGGAVNGGNIFGTVPPAGLDHDWDAGRGRLIPDTSIEQFAKPLGRWFGLSNSEINAVFPALPQFGPPPTFI